MFWGKSAHPPSRFRWEWPRSGQHVPRAGPQALRQPWGRVHWASTELAEEWFGYMEGALASGEQTATHVAAALAVERASVSKL